MELEISIILFFRVGRPCSSIISLHRQQQHQHHRQTYEWHAFRRERRLSSVRRLNKMKINSTLYPLIHALLGAASPIILEKKRWRKWLDKWDSFTSFFFFLLLPLFLYLLPHRRVIKSWPRNGGIISGSSTSSNFHHECDKVIWLWSMVSVAIISSRKIFEWGEWRRRQRGNKTYARANMKKKKIFFFSSASPSQPKLA